jgi:hypothetical protein
VSFEVPQWNNLRNQLNLIRDAVLEGNEFW